MFSWMTSNKLFVNPDKTEYLLCNPNDINFSVNIINLGLNGTYPTVNIINLGLNGTYPSDSAKNLGVIF